MKLTSPKSVLLKFESFDIKLSNDLATCLESLTISSGVCVYQLVRHENDIFHLSHLRTLSSAAKPIDTHVSLQTYQVRAPLNKPRPATRLSCASSEDKGGPGITLTENTARHPHTAVSLLHAYIVCPTPWDIQLSGTIDRRSFSIKSSRKVLAKQSSRLLSQFAPSISSTTSSAASHETLFVAQSVPFSV